MCVVQHRDRVVSKLELLERLWPDAIVVDAETAYRRAHDWGGVRSPAMPSCS
ncbi:hypothetical protein [Sedimenticola sp.]|uniref:hypothetical protein n=1 Tax=Sedimenticola sp. TaxID=1940285 RepID=UPI003D0974EF